MPQESDLRIEGLMRKYDHERRIRCFREELRKTKHALWIARAERAKDLRTLGNFRKYVSSHIAKCRSIYAYPKQGYPGTYLHKRMIDAFETWCRNFKIVEDKCREKAKEYE